MLQAPAALAVVPSSGEKEAPPTANAALTGTEGSFSVLDAVRECIGDLASGGLRSLLAAPAAAAAAAPSAAAAVPALRAAAAIFRAALPCPLPAKLLGAQPAFWDDLCAIAVECMRVEGTPPASVTELLVYLADTAASAVHAQRSAPAAGCMQLAQTLLRGSSGICGCVQLLQQHCNVPALLEQQAAGKDGAVSAARVAALGVRSCTTSLRLGLLPSCR